MHASHCDTKMEEIKASLIFKEHRCEQGATHLVWITRAHQWRTYADVSQWNLTERKNNLSHKARRCHSPSEAKGQWSSVYFGVFLIYIEWKLLKL